MYSQSKIKEKKILKKISIFVYIFENFIDFCNTAYNVDKQGNLMHNRIPDPVRCEINKLKAEVEILKEKFNK